MLTRRMPLLLGAASPIVVPEPADLAVELGGALLPARAAVAVERLAAGAGSGTGLGQVLCRVP